VLTLFEIVKQISKGKTSIHIHFAIKGSSEISKCLFMLQVLIFVAESKAALK